MLFIDKEHHDFYKNMLTIFHEKNGSIDCYSKSLFYLIGLTCDTRNHINSIFDFNNCIIKPSSINADWQTGSSKKITRLAFNLWNGSAFDSDKDYENNKLSKHFTVNEIFCCSYARYFFQAIKLRYPEYTNN